MRRFNNFLLIDATDRSKIRSDQKRFFIALSPYPLSFFANTPFKYSLVRAYKLIWLKKKYVKSWREYEYKVTMNSVKYCP